MDINQLLERIRKEFPSYPSLSLGILLILIFYFSILDKFLIEITANLVVRSAICLTFILIWLLIWVYFRGKYPNSGINKIGLVICIEAENDKQKIRIKNDFVTKLNSLLSKNNLADEFDVMLLNDFQTESVNKILYNHSEVLKRLKTNKNTRQDHKVNRQWEKVKNKIGGNFWIFGRIKERSDIENKYVFDLEARVSHIPIPISNVNPVEKAFKESWVKRITFDEKIELFGFDFAAELIFIGLNYVTGIAAYISYDPFTAFKLHESLLREISQNFKPLPPNLENLKINLLEFLSFECVLICQDYLQKGDGPNAKKYLDKIFIYSPDNYDGYLLKSVYEYSIENDAQKALASCKLAAKRSAQSGTWRYNKAFLLLQLNRYEDALKVYYEIENYSFKGEDNTIEQVIQFNEQRLIDNSNDIISNFILGFVHFKKKDNLPLAFEYFNKIKSYHTIKKINDSLLRKVDEYLKVISQQTKWG